MEKDIKITIEFPVDSDRAMINIAGASSEQIAYLTPRLLELMDEIRHQKAAEY